MENIQKDIIHKNSLSVRPPLLQQWDCAFRKWSAALPKSLSEESGASPRCRFAGGALAPESIWQALAMDVTRYSSSVFLQPHQLISGWLQRAITAPFFWCLGHKLDEMRSLASYRQNWLLYLDQRVSKPTCRPPQGSSSTTWKKPHSPAPYRWSILEPEASEDNWNTTCRRNERWDIFSWLPPAAITQNKSQCASIRLCSPMISIPAHLPRVCGGRDQTAVHVCACESKQSERVCWVTVRSMLQLV